ncbi:MAG TPA: glycoside hydrolase family 88 protein [Candidatus Acidoferrales bacterium]|jgi:unsaturated rhamnogalacturonyl hydrolase|nr:glycoside hydrolase family 88 protein [Candidatus Acidoferrales bacterium]
MNATINRMLNIRHWLFVIPALVLLCTSCATNRQVAQKYSGATPVEWSQRLAASQMARYHGPPKWDYTMGLFSLSLLKLNEQAPDARYLKFAEDAVGSLVAADGTIQGYKMEEYQLDAMNPGKTLLAMWQITHKTRYKNGALSLVYQLKFQPRTPGGGFWHKQRYTQQMWLDGIYMGSPFYAECGKLFGEPADFDDVAKQISLIDEHTYDAATGLNYHGWDAMKTQPWANPVTGCSSNFWGRAEGWYAMALVDVLDYFPTNHPARPQIIATLQKLAAGVVKYQDPKTGLWWQVMDAGDRKGNYQEATASTMFVYALAKGVNRGYLSRDYVPAIERGYAGILKNLIRDDGGEKWSLTKCCSVAGLGGSPSNGKMRDGSFDYYVGEPVVDNDLKGVGPFILAGIEMEGLH